MEFNLSNPTVLSSTPLDKDSCQEVFMRLPIKSLCRFRCVSKSWNLLISSSYFVRSFPSSVNPKLHLRIDFRGNNHDSCAVYTQQGNLVEDFESSPLHFPFRSQGLTFVDAIRGVICVSYSVNSPFDSIILWNPTIRKYAALPFLPFLLDAPEFDSTTLFSSNAIGFGFVESTQEFKVVRVWTPSGSIERNQDQTSQIYEVYSTKRRAWRISVIDQTDIKSWEFNTHGSKASRTGCFFNGAIHWLLTTFDTSRSYSILTFDCETEEFATIKLPEEIYQTEMTRNGQLGLKIELLEYNGKLSVLVYSSLSWQRQLELWVMVEYEAANSWRKLFRLPDGVEVLATELATHNPTHWTKLTWNVDRFDEILSGHSYEESLQLMDDPMAQPYAKEDKFVI